MWNINQSPQVRDVAIPCSFNLIDFSERTLQAFSKTLHKAHEASQPLLPIFIQSDGGRADILFGMMSLMESYRKKGMKFAATVSGTASSAGCCLFLFSDFRYMGEFSSLLFHSSQVSFENNLPAVMSMIEFIKSEDERMNEVLEKHLKKKKGWFKSQMRKNGVDDWLISARVAHELGLATSISIPEFNLTIRSEFSIS